MQLVMCNLVTRYLGLVLFFIIAFFSIDHSKPSASAYSDPLSTPDSSLVMSQLNKLPLRFESAPRQNRFLARGKGYEMELEPSGASIRLRNAAKDASIKMQLIQSREQSAAITQEPLPGQMNYFIGIDAQQWRKNVQSFGRITYQQVYPGIDLVWHGQQQQLEFDFNVAAKANPSKIRFRFDGAQQLALQNDGKLSVSVAGESVEFLKPVAWQMKGDNKLPGDCNFAIDQRQEVSFKLGKYDPTLPLVIDPVLLYATYLGGTGNETGEAIAVDKDRNIYVTGTTNSRDFPGSSSIQSALAGDENDIYVLKLNPTGTTMLWGTWIGGSRSELSQGVTLDANGNVYVTGVTNSPNFPTTSGALQRDLRGPGDAFVLKVAANGSALTYSTLLGGKSDDSGSGIAVDAAGNAYIAGSTYSKDLLNGRVTSAIQMTRMGNELFQSTNRAMNWSAIQQNTLDVLRVYSFTYDQKIAGLVYAVTPNGLFKSSNNGNSWSFLTGTDEFFVSPGFRGKSLFIDPQNSQILYYLTVYGVFKSTNGGQTWTEKTTQQTGQVNFSGFSLALDPINTGTVYLGSQAGLFKSTNGGDSWTKLNLGAADFGRPITGVYALAINPRNRLNLYAAHQSGIIQTADGGTVWSSINSGLPNGTAQFLVIDPLNNNTAYAAYLSQGVYRTTDGGTTWAPRSTGLGFNGLTGVIYNVEMDNQQADTLYALVGNGRLYKSTNGGGNWAASNEGLTQYNCTSFALDVLQQGRMLLSASIGADGFVARLNNTGTAVSWMTYLGGAEHDFFTSLALDKSGNVLVAGSTESSEIPAINPEAQFTDAFVAKINNAGTQTIFSAKFGGNGVDLGESIALTANDKVVVAGSTSSNGSPFAPLLQTAFGGGNTDAFIAGLNLNGNGLEFAAWLGGSNNDRATAVAVDQVGNLHVAGITASPNFPLRDAFQTEQGALNAQNLFYAKLNPTASAISFSTYLGGSGPDTLSAMTLDANGQAYLTGSTNSANFPLQAALKTSRGGFNDAFVAKIGTEADLAITVAQSRNPVQVNSNFNYSAIITNNGAAPATGIKLVADLPAGVSLVASSGADSACTQVGITVTCNLSSLANRASKTIQLTVKGANAGIGSAAFRVSGNELDPISTNNAVNLQTSVVTAPSLYGRVTLQTPGVSGVTSLAGVTVQISGTQSTSRTTNAEGNYQFTTNNGGNFTLTPALNGYSFEPASRSLTNVTTDQSADFLAQPCSYNLTTFNQSFSANGGNGSIAVVGTARCPWTASTSDSWIRLTGGIQGSGNGTVNFAVSPTTMPRVGKIRVAGFDFVVWQGVGECSSARFGMSTYRVPFTIPAAPARAVIDFNDDKRADVLVLVGGYLSLMTMDAAGIPAAPRILAQGITGQAVYGTDLNADNKPDAIVRDINNRNIKVFLNRGDGTLASAVDYVYASGEDTFGLSQEFIQDINKDGKRDLVFTKPPTQFSDPTKMAILLNQGAGTFGAPINLMVAGRIVALADFTGDTVPDLVTQDIENGLPVLRLFPGDGFGSFAAAKVSAGEQISSNALVADFNGDGNPDLAGNGTKTEKQYFFTFLGDGKGNFASAALSPLSDITPLSQIVRGDFNNDAKPDIAFNYQNGLALAYGIGDGKFAAPQLQRLARETDYLGDLVVGDFNGDGRPDITTNIGTSSEITLHLNRCGGPSGLVIAGRIFTPDSSVNLENITLKISGGRTAETRTDIGGNFQFNGLAANTTYVITPERTGMAFDPPNVRLDNLSSDQNLLLVAERRAVVTSAANYRTETFAPGSIVAVFGVDLSASERIANTIPLPTELGGVRIQITDNQGYAGDAQLFYVSPRQLNVLLPSDMPLRPMTMGITSQLGNGASAYTRTTFNVENVVPGLFAANATGLGYAAAVALRIRANGSQSYEPIATFDINSLRYLPIPLDVSNANEQVFLLLFGTGIAKHDGLNTVSATMGGQPSEVLFAGPQGSLAGLDQVNLRVPRTLAGRGDVDILLSVSGKAANIVKVNIR